MFAEQAMNFIQSLFQATQKREIQWYRYPVAYPFENNKPLKMELANLTLSQKKIDIAHSYFSMRELGSVFVFSVIDENKNNSIMFYAQQNLGSALVSLTYEDDLILSTFTEIEKSVDYQEGQPWGIYSFFDNFLPKTEKL